MARIIFGEIINGVRRRREGTEGGGGCGPFFGGGGSGWGPPPRKFRKWSAFLNFERNIFENVWK